MTHKLAKIREDEGNIQEAANIIQELQVETYGSMEKREKVELILEQMRLCLAKQDYIRTQIISKKINTKFFEEEGKWLCSNIMYNFDNCSDKKEFVVSIGLQILLSTTSITKPVFQELNFLKISIFLENIIFSLFCCIF